MVEGKRDRSSGRILDPVRAVRSRHKIRCVEHHLGGEIWKHPRRALEVIGEEHGHSAVAMTLERVVDDVQVAETIEFDLLDPAEGRGSRGPTSIARIAGLVDLP